MNKNQLIILWIGIIIFVLVSINPPQKSYPNTPIHRTDNEPIVEIIGAGEVDGVKLLSRWSIIIVLTGGLIYTFKDKRPKTEQNNK